MPHGRLARAFAQARDRLDCSCVPDISLVPYTGGDVLVVESDGGIGKLGRQ
jgi:hypothetical protein